MQWIVDDGFESVVLEWISLCAFHSLVYWECYARLFLLSALVWAKNHFCMQFTSFVKLFWQGFF